MKKTLIAVVGPTAIGKTSWAIQLARHFKTEIISTDSRQFYKEMKIGTAVPSKNELASAKHHFIQHRSIIDPWSVGDFEKSALNGLEELFTHHNLVIAAGGSGLYLKAMVEGLDQFPNVPPTIRQELNEEFSIKGLGNLQSQLKKADPEYYKQVDLQNPHRIIRALEIFRTCGRPYSSFLGKEVQNRHFGVFYLGIGAERSEVYRRINERVDMMMEAGLLDEARELFQYRDLKALQTVGYQELFQYIEGKWDLDMAVSEIKKNTRRYAKRQLTWLRKNDAIFWVDHKANVAEVIDKIETELKQSL
ncbi:MAG: tRNA (adenosine(37)-N6)-dimethylallyltransferase MiaA [Flavobacteriaceae bacterium]